MSETTTAIFKLITALTSPKAALKYLSVAASIVFIWKYLNSALINFGVPESQLSLIILLFGVGIGSIIGQIAGWIYETIWGSIKKSIDEKNQKKKDMERVLASRIEANNKDIFVQEKYSKSFQHFNRQQEEKLRILTLREVTLDLSNRSFLALKENDYIKIISHIQNDQYLVSLNPCLMHFTKENWNNEKNHVVDEFFKEMTSNKEKLLKLMLKNEEDSDSIIDFDIGDVIGSHYGCIHKELESKEGFWLSFQPYYVEEFSNHTGEEYLDEIWIDQERIKL